MQRPARARPVRPPKAERQAAPPGYWRDRLAVLLALVTVICLGVAFFRTKDMRFLSPGPLTSAHNAIESCNACHTNSGSGRASWLYGLIATDPQADSTACLTCHKVPGSVFNAHGASAQVLEQSTNRLTKVAAQIPAPHWARAQGAAFPAQSKAGHALYCATCHQEHQGLNFNLNKISNEQCNSCHVVKLDSFDGYHPEFQNYPFKQRTPIIYDHAAHVGKHFPELAKQNPARRIPATCSTCHNSNADRRMMAVAPFEQTCSSCHLGQITGKDRVSGPKGIPFLALPGLDLQTLRRKNAAIGEWPTESEAELTPFMKVMISRNERGRALIKTVQSLNLQDLTDASDDQIAAVADLVWEIKRLFHALIRGKASDVLGDLNIQCGAKLSEGLVTDLTASIPRDVVVGAYLQWLPNLGAEMANRQFPADQEPSCWITTVGNWTTTTESTLAVGSESAGAAQSGPPPQANQETATADAPGSIAGRLRVDPYGRLVKKLADEAEAPRPDAARPDAARPEAARAPAPRPEAPAARTEAVSGTPDAGKKAAAADERPQARAADRPPAKAADQTDDLLNPTEEELRELPRAGGTAVRGYTAYAGADGRPETSSADGQAGAARADLKDAVKVAQAEGGARRPAPPSSKAADQTDDLLNPTEDELRGLPGPGSGAEKAAQPEGAVRRPAIPSPNRAPEEAASAKAATPPSDAAPKADARAPAGAPPVSNAAAAPPQVKAAPVVSIESDVDPENWAEYGGWYRQDYTIFYRPVGHKDKFIFSWLYLTGPQSPKGDRSPAAAVFDYLTSKDAQGSCTKCHSVDDIGRQGRLVNFSPPKIETRQGRFTSFIHEPHFSILENRGCLTCHSLEKGRPYLQNYEHGNPKKAVSNFGAVKKELCETCHTSSMARQDCLLCHKYHVNGVTTPIMSTRLPVE